MSRVLVGKIETVTLPEAEEMRDDLLSNFYGYLIGMVDDLTDNEDERATAKVNLAKMVSQLLAAEMLRVSLMSDIDILNDLLGENFAATAKFSEQKN